MVYTPGVLPRDCGATASVHLHAFSSVGRVTKFVSKINKRTDV